MARPPTVTTSVPTVPLADDWSPYEICQVLPEASFHVLLLEGSKMVWPACLPWVWTLWLRLVDQTLTQLACVGWPHRHEDELTKGLMSQCRNQESGFEQEFRWKLDRDTQSRSVDLQLRPDLRVRC